MRIDPTCPVDVQKCDLTGDDNGRVRAYVRLCNCAGCALIALEGSAQWLDAHGEVQIETSFSMDSMSIETGEIFPLTVAASLPSRSAGMELCFTRAQFADGSEWTGSAESLRDFPDPVNLPGSLVNALVAEAGGDAVCCAQESESGDWLCVCGRWNDRANESCMRCRRDKSDTLVHFSAEAVRRFPPQHGSNDVEPPVVENAGYENHSTGPEITVHRSGNLKRILIAMLLAAVFACTALCVRTYRFRRTHAAGLMPTSYISTTLNI